MTATREAVPLHVRSQGTGKPLLILHGLYGSGMNWNRIARTLARSRAVHLPDLRNHGQSPHDPDMTYPAMAADILALMDTLGLETASVLGHSMGGKVAMQLALTYPERIQGLLVADMAPVPYSGTGHDRLIDSLQSLDLKQVDSRESASRLLAEAIPETGVRQFLLTNLEHRDDHWRWRIPLDILNNSLDTILGWPDPSGRYEGPALFVHGGKSDYVTERGTTAIHDAFPTAVIQTMPACGHWLHAEDPEGFTDIVRRFMEEHGL